MFWIGHHNICHLVRRTDRVFLWLNLLFLMSITLIPYTGSLLGMFPFLRPAVRLYGVNLALNGLTLYWVQFYATHKRRLVDENLDPGLVRLGRIRILGPALVAGIAEVVATWSIVASHLLYYLILFTYLIPVRLDKMLPDAMHPTIRDEDSVVKAEEIVP